MFVTLGVIGNCNKKVIIIIFYLYLANNNK